MGLFERKDALPAGARRFLEAAFEASAGKRPAGTPLALGAADARAILKDLDWDAPEAAEFLAAAKIPKDALAAFKTGDRPDLLAGVLKDSRVFPYFENFLCCCCCCGPCRLCRIYPFCKRRYGRIQVKLTDGSTLWAYRLEIEGVAVESIPGRPGVAKVSIPGAAGGVTVAAFGAHAGDPAAHGVYAPASHDAYHDAHNDARYAPKSADVNGYADKGDLDGKAPKVWDATTPTADVPSGYAKASDLTAKAPKVWDATTPAGDVPSGYAPATGSAEYAPAKDASSNPIHYLAKGAGTPSNGIELANASDGTKAADVSTVLHASNAYESSGAVTAHAAIPGAHGDFASAGHAHQLGDGTLTGFPSTLPLNALSGISSIAARNAAVPLEVPIAGLGAVDAKIRAFATVHLRTTASGANSPYFVAQVQAGNGGTKLLVSVQDATGAAPNTNDSFFDGKTFQIAWMATQVS